MNDDRISVEEQDNVRRPPAATTADHPRSRRTVKSKDEVGHWNRSQSVELVNGLIQNAIKLSQSRQLVRNQELLRHDLTTKAGRRDSEDHQVPPAATPTDHRNGHHEATRRPINFAEATN